LSAAFLFVDKKLKEEAQYSFRFIVKKLAYDFCDELETVFG
jgi:hypothetical protein